MQKGFTLLEIMIVVAVIGLLSVIAIPSFMRARATSQKNACINNLRQIESAKDQYTIENGLTNGATLLTTDTLAFGALVAGTAPSGGYIKSYPNCPASTNAAAGAAKTAASSANDYKINVIGSNAMCRIVAATHVLQ